MTFRHTAQHSIVFVARVGDFYEAWGVTSTRSEHVPALVRDYQNNVESLNAQLRDKYHGTDLRSSVADIQAKRKKFASAMELSTPPQQIAYGTPTPFQPPSTFAYGSLVQSR